MGLEYPWNLASLAVSGTIPWIPGADCIRIEWQTGHSWASRYVLYLELQVPEPRISEACRGLA